MALGSLRRGRGFHKRRHRPNVARDELAKATKEAVRETVEPPLVRRQGKGKGGDGKGGRGNDGGGKGKAAPSPSGPPAAPIAAEPLPTAAAPSNSIVLDAGNPAETIVPPLNPPSTVAPPQPGQPPPPQGAPNPSSTTTSSNLTTSTAVTSVQTTQTSIQTNTTVITTAQTSTQVSTQVTTTVSTQIDTSTSLVGSPQQQMTVALTSSMITSPLPTLQTSLSTAASTSTPFVATAPYQAAPSSSTIPPAASRPPAIAPGTTAGIVVGILSFFLIILGAVCLCSRRTRQRLLTRVTRRFTNNTLPNSGPRSPDPAGRRPGRGGGAMHKPLMSEAESMAYTATSPRDVKPPPMAMVEPGRGLSQDPVFTGAAACPSRPSSWRTWRPSATFAQGLGPAPDNLQPPPPPPRGSGGSTGGDSSMPDEYGAWPPTASDAGLTALTPAPGQRQQQGEAGGGRHALSYVVAYWETPLATPRTPTVVEAGRAAERPGEEEEEEEEAQGARSDESAAASADTVTTDPRAAFEERSWAGRLERVAAMAAARKGSRRSHRAGKAGSRRSRGSRASRGSVASRFSRKLRRSQRQPGPRGRSTSRRPAISHAPSPWDWDGGSEESSSEAGFSWSEAASEPYTAPRDGFGLSIIGARPGSTPMRTGERAGPGPCTTARLDRDG